MGRYFKQNIEIESRILKPIIYRVSKGGIAVRNNKYCRDIAKSLQHILLGKETETDWNTSTEELMCEVMDIANFYGIDIYSRC